MCAITPRALTTRLETLAESVPARIVIKYDRIRFYVSGVGMRTITATELARNLRRVLDRLVIGGEEIVIERNREEIGRLVPGPARQTALEAMGDLYRTLPEAAAATWEADSRRGRWKGSRLDKGIRDPWPS